jgi:hypothetical protein
MLHLEYKKITDMEEIFQKDANIVLEGRPQKIRVGSFGFI